MDRRLTDEVQGGLSPLGVRASLDALEQLRVKDRARRDALGRQLEEAEYVARRAFEQDNAVDARHRLVAAELERRWNLALADVERLRATLTALEQDQPVLSAEDRAAPRSWRSVNTSPRCGKVRRVRRN